MGLEIPIAILGLLLHWAAKWVEYREEEAVIGAWAYLQVVPAKTFVATVSACLAYLVCYSLEWMNPGMALACGYMGNSVVDNIAGKYGKPP